MVKIICQAVDCIFWEDNLCTSEEITYDPDEGCLTYEVIDDVLPMNGEDWEEDEEDDDLEAAGFHFEDDELNLLEDDDDW